MDDDEIFSKMQERRDWVKEHKPELERAEARIGNAPADVARWILDRFYETNLADLSAGGRLDLQWETWVFARGTAPSLALGKPIPTPDSVDLKAFQEIVTEVVNTALTPAAVVRFEYKSFSELFGVLPGYGVKISPDFADEIELYKHTIIHKFRPFADTLARCAACNRVFHKRQDNQLYCSVRCQNRMAAREYRKQSKPTPQPKRRENHGKKR
jgi:hypothetical protein